MRSFWAQPEGTRRFSRRAVSAALAVLLDIGCVALLALHAKHSRPSREIQSDRLLGAEIIPSTPEGLGQFIKSDLAKWSRVVKSSGIKVE